MSKVAHAEDRMEVHPVSNRTRHPGTLFKWMENHNCLSPDPLTVRGSRVQLCKMLLFVMIPIVLLFAETAWILNNHHLTVNRASDVQENVLFSINSGTIVHYLQIERGTTALYVSSKGNTRVLESLEVKRKNVDLALDNLTYWPEYADTSLPQYSSKTSFKEHIVQHRKNLRYNETSIRSEIEFYSPFIEEIIAWIGRSVWQSGVRDMATWPSLIAYHLLMVSKEQAGVQRAIGSTFYARGRFEPYKTVKFAD